MEENNQLNLTYASSIENIDFAFYEWLDHDFNLFCSSKDGFKKVPIIWVTPERAYQIKINKEFRDFDGTLNVPMITVERTSIEKDQKINGTYYANIPPNNNRHIVAKRINQKKTSEFANADKLKKYGSIGFVSPRKNEKIVYQFSSMMLPVYAKFTYVLTVFTQFQQQMNEILQPFITKFGSTRYFLIEKNGYKYECFLEPNFETKNNINSMEEEERRYITNITIKVLGNLVSQGINEEDSVFKTYENAVEIKLPRDGILARNSFPEGRTLNSSTFQTFPEFINQKIFNIGDGSSSSYTISHNLNSKNILVIVTENETNSRINTNIQYINNNEITLNFGYTINLNQYTVTVIG